MKYSIISILPFLGLCIVAFGVLIIEVFSKRGAKTTIAGLSLIGIAFSIYYTILLWGKKGLFFNNMVAMDNYSLFFNIVLLISAGITILLSTSYINREGINNGEYYALILFSTIGGMLMVSTIDLIVIFLGLELLSISIYVLAGFMKGNPRSNESALKYFLLGAFSTGFLLYGIALIYGATGSTNLKNIGTALPAVSSSPLILVGMALIIVGFGFKISSVPFHMWTPDVYEGAPTSITAFMSTVSKVAGFAALLRILTNSMSAMYNEWSAALWVIAVLTMTLGNVVALTQINIKRMLAYSSIAHAGYILIGIIASGDTGISSSLFYLAVYILMNLGAFGVAIILSRIGDEGYDINGYSGLAERQPLLAFVMAIFMLSLSGIPPFAGFIGKFYIFSASVKSGFVLLAIIGVINSVISVFYYLRIVVLMYMREPIEAYAITQSGIAMNIALLISTIGIIILGLFPSFIFRFAQNSTPFF